MFRPLIVLFIILQTNSFFGQIVFTQDHNDATIGLDRKAWAGLGNTANHSDGYAHDFTLPARTNSCEQISGISVEISLSNYIYSGPCSHFETYYNLFYGCTPYAGGATCLPATNLIAEPNFPPNTSPPVFNFGNPLGSPVNPNIVPDFGDNLSIDIIPVSNPGCNAVTNGDISYEYTITVTVTIINVTPAEPAVVDCWDNFVFNTVTCAWDNTGTQPATPTGLECWETAIFNDTTCAWEVTGTQPAQPTLECWETATFNDTTCVWEVTGTQPAQPDLECWETTTFNDTTCAWEVTGTQPTQPTLECWETTTFNDTTCIWKVTGTQPTQPDLECWETTTFNDTTCTWEVIGTQPAQPTLECWETATFNDTTCVWEITGTQPTQPDLECWETATFNNTTCVWDISGTQPIEPTTVNCWDDFQFNDSTCQWENIGIEGGSTPIIASVDSDGNNIVVTTSNTGDFEYSLDGIFYQNSNVFLSTDGGQYTIYARNRNGCGTVAELEHLHFFIPSFFTPNGDTRNETFDLKGIEFYASNEVYIFDRYGKLLKNSKNLPFKWNGTFNGEKLPTSDYWYIIIIEGQRFTGHFTLKR